MNESTELWHKHARQWNRVGQPLRPTAADIRLMETLVQQCCADSECLAPCAIMLGVTPEIATMQWPPATDLIALDCSLPMISEIWPGDTTGRRAVCADWFAAPLRAHSCDLIVSDAALNQLATASAYQPAARSLSALLADGGRVIMRLFVRPDEAETPAAVLGALNAGEIGNFHIFKWRLAMSLQRDFASGIALGEVWQAWHTGVADVDSLAARHGWAPEAVRTLEAYREVATRFTFPTLGELRRELAQSFVEEACHIPTYEMGDRCPTLVLAARTGPQVPS